MHEQPSFWTDAAPVEAAALRTTQIRFSLLLLALATAFIWMVPAQSSASSADTGPSPNNPDPTLRARKLIGLQLLSGFVRDDGQENVWTGVQIYSPVEGKTYSCTLTLENGKTLRVRGYIGLSVLGKTQIWTRVE